MARVASDWVELESTAFHESFIAGSKKYRPKQCAHSQSLKDSFKGKKKTVTQKESRPSGTSLDLNQVRAQP